MCQIAVGFFFAIVVYIPVRPSFEYPKRKDRRLQFAYLFHSKLASGTGVAEDNDVDIYAS